MEYEEIDEFANNLEKFHRWYQKSFKKILFPIEEFTIFLRKCKKSI